MTVSVVSVVPSASVIDRVAVVVFDERRGIALGEGDREVDAAWRAVAPSSSASRSITGVSLTGVMVIVTVAMFDSAAPSKAW